jgi:hypothetical protein
MPVFADLSDGKKHEVKAAQDIEFPAGSIVLADRAYVDFNWLRQLSEQGVFFDILGKENIKLEQAERTLRPTDEENQHIQNDWEGNLPLPRARVEYPLKLRMVHDWDEEQEIELELLTHNFS